MSTATKTIPGPRIDDTFTEAKATVSLATFAAGSRIQDAPAPPLTPEAAADDPPADFGAWPLAVARDHIMTHPAQVSALLDVELVREGGARKGILRALLAAERSAEGQNRDDVVAAIDGALA